MRRNNDGFSLSLFRSCCFTAPLPCPALPSPAQPGPAWPCPGPWPWTWTFSSPQPERERRLDCRFCPLLLLQSKLPGRPCSAIADTRRGAARAEGQAGAARKSGQNGEKKERKVDLAAAAAPRERRERKGGPRWPPFLPLSLSLLLYCIIYDFGLELRPDAGSTRPGATSGALPPPPGDLLYCSCVPAVPPGSAWCAFPEWVEGRSQLGFLEPRSGRRPFFFDTAELSCCSASPFLLLLLLVPFWSVARAAGADGGQGEEEEKEEEYEPNYVRAKRLAYPSRGVPDTAHFLHVLYYVLLYDGS